MGSLLLGFIVKEERLIPPQHADYDYQFFSSSSSVIKGFNKVSNFCFKLSLNILPRILVFLHSPILLKFLIRNFINILPLTKTFYLKFIGFRLL